MQVKPEAGASPGPLSNVRVIEIGFAVAGPMAATLMADFGADVVKVELPGQGDGMRSMGPKEQGVGIWWLVAARNKKSITVNLKTEEGKTILRGLLAEADVLVENFRPGVMESLGFDWDTLRALNPRLVMLRVSGFGQTGPYSHRPGFGKIAEAVAGATNLTGHAHEPPLHPGYSLGDVVCALMGAYGVMLALHSRQQSGKGQVVDLALYEPLFRLIEWQLPLHTITKTPIHRDGPRFPFADAFMTNICPTRDGDHVVVSAATLPHLERLAGLLRDHGIEGDLSGTSALSEGTRQYIQANDAQTVINTFLQHELVAGLVYTPADMLEDEHMKARGNIVNMPHPMFGQVPMPSVVPALGETPGSIRWIGPDLGQHTEEILRDRLGYDQERVAALRAAGVL